MDGDSVRNFRSNSCPDISKHKTECTEEILGRSHNYPTNVIIEKQTTIIDFKSKEYIEKTDDKTPQIDNPSWMILPINMAIFLTNTVMTNKYRNISYWNGIYLIIILAACIGFSVPLILIPMQDQIMHPSYWWQTSYTASLSYTLSLVLTSFQEFKIVFQDSFPISASVCGRIYIFVTVFTIIPFFAIYWIWISLMKNNAPIPLFGTFGYYIYITTIITIWFQIPVRGECLQNRKIIRKKYHAYFLYYMWCGITSIQYNSTSLMFAKLPTDIQWVAALFLLLLREVNTWVLQKLMVKAVKEHSNDAQEMDAKMAALIYINCQHSFYVAIAIGNTATPATTYILLFGDFMLNMYSSCKIMQLHRMTSVHDWDFQQKNKKNEEKALTLVLIETLEILVPIAFSISFLLAYYGPNAEVLGNVKNEYWQFKGTKVDHAGNFIASVFRMFFVDLLSAIIGGLLLWKFCTLNMLSVGCTMIRSYWPMIALKCAQRMTMVIGRIICFLYFSI